jgi:putative hydrolase of the HAD superfamily
VFARLIERGQLAPTATEAIDWERLAVEYEARANPCWPMPHLRECLGQLRQQLPLGIISNAQFYTPLLFPALLDQTVDECGLDPNLQFYSYRHGRAKPGTGLYEMAAHALSKRGIEPCQALYVGNDMLNDIMPADRVGFRTALFAGDARSLRRREDDARVTDITPTLVITDLDQLSACTMI